MSIIRRYAVYSLGVSVYHKTRTNIFFMYFYSHLSFCCRNWYVGRQRIIKICRFYFHLSFVPNWLLKIFLNILGLILENMKILGSSWKKCTVPNIDELLNSDRFSDENVSCYYLNMKSYTSILKDHRVKKENTAFIFGTNDGNSN